MSIAPTFYNPDPAWGWSGRIDGDQNDRRRWHQIVQPVNLHTLPKADHPIALLGFASDEGVQRNQGRPGAAKGPTAIRKACCNLPFFIQRPIWDVGDIACQAENLEDAQRQLASAVDVLHRAQAFPILLGGGHEIVYGHYKGLRQAYPTASIGIINIDAHFDLRKPAETGPNSGTGFWQIAQEVQASGYPFHYMALGIQKAANTQELFTRADALDVVYVMDRFVSTGYSDRLTDTIEKFAQRVDVLYLTIDLDAFPAAYAPGVSAANPRGVTPDGVIEILFDAIFGTHKVKSVDIAELNPRFDIDDRTAKLAARLVFEISERL